MISTLIVDPDSERRELYDAVLGRSFQKILVSTAEEGLVSYSRNNMPLVVVYADLQGISGVEFCRRLRHQSGGRSLKILLIGDELDDNVLGPAVASKLGVDALLKSPFEKKRLRSKVRELVGALAEEAKFKAGLVREPDPEPTSEPTPPPEPAPEPTIESKPVIDLEPEPPPETEFKAEPYLELDLDQEPRLQPEIESTTEPDWELDLDQEPESALETTVEPQAETEQQQRPVPNVTIDQVESAFGKMSEVDIGRIGENRLAMVFDWVGRMDDLDYYALLYVRSTATLREIKNAYFYIARYYHPDRFALVENEKFRFAVNLFFKRCGEGYQVLKKPEKRKIYDDLLEKGEGIRLIEKERNSGPKRPEDTIKDQQAKKFYKLAITALNDGDINSAKMNLSFARSAEPDNEAILQKIDELNKG